MQTIVVVIVPAVITALGSIVAAWIGRRQPARRDQSASGLER
ncbi:MULTISPECIES: hypothetical protein [Streptomyces]|nr:MULTISPECIES: hypothetical protein [Streptomyces]WGK50542.1 hypothetical protein M6G09_35740 [Streptomyces sp. B146]